MGIYGFFHIFPDLVPAKTLPADILSTGLRFYLFCIVNVGSFASIPWLRHSFILQNVILISSG